MNIEKALKEARKVYNVRYDLSIDDIDALKQETKGDLFKVIYYAFNIGFLRGTKATKADYERNNKGVKTA